MGALRLGIDLDGVVADFNLGWMQRYNDEFGAALQPDDVRSWDGLLPLTHFRDMEEFWAWFRRDRPTIFRHLPLVDGALEALRHLARRHHLVVISSKFDWAVPDTLAWLAEHGLPAREIHFVWDKTTVACDAYLEDAPHNLEALVDTHPDSLVCRMVQPWNTPLPGARDVTVWPEFVRLVEGREATERAVR